MGKRYVLLAAIVLLVGLGRSHPIESKIRAQLLRALREEFSETVLSNESAIPDPVFEDSDTMYMGMDREDISTVRAPCINLGNDGCVNGSIVGSGGDEGYLGGTGNPGK